jgi:hypothetical protein
MKAIESQAQDKPLNGISQVIEKPKAIEAKPSAPRVVDRRFRRM